VNERVGARAGWTRLLAAAVAHDINNLAHSLLGAPGLGAPQEGGVDAEAATFVEDCLAQMRKLGARLRTLGSAGEADARARLDDALADAWAEVDLVHSQVMRTEPIPAELRARGTAAAVRTAIASLVEHAAAAAPPGGTIQLSVRPEPPGSIIVEISVPEASGLGEIGTAPLETLLDTTLRDMRGNFSLVLAGAMADALGGAVHLASSAQRGLVLALRLVAGS
jgi:hypothetical protein